MSTIQAGSDGSPIQNPAFPVAPVGFNALVAFNARELAAVVGDDGLAAASDEPGGGAGGPVVRRGRNLGGCRAHGRRVGTGPNAGRPATPSWSRTTRGGRQPSSTSSWIRQPTVVRPGRPECIVANRRSIPMPTGAGPVWPQLAYLMSWPRIGTLLSRLAPWPGERWPARGPRGWPSTGTPIPVVAWVPCPSHGPVWPCCWPADAMRGPPKGLPGDRASGGCPVAEPTISSPLSRRR